MSGVLEAIRLAVDHVMAAGRGGVVQLPRLGRTGRYRVEFRILGAFDVMGPEGPVTLGGAKRRGLLAFLVVHAGQTASLDRLVDALWCEQPSKGAGSTVQTYLSQLRNLFATSHDVSLETQPGGYVLQAPTSCIDAARFEQLFTQAIVESDPCTRLRGLDEAFALWRGRPLCEFAGAEWADLEATRLEALHLQALQQRIDALLALGRHTEAIPELEALVTDYRLDERFWAQLMLVYYRVGRQADALRAYQEVRSILADELGIEPGTELAELERKILDHDPDLMRAAETRVDSSARELLPEGAATFLFTDIEGSTRLWEQQPEAMRAALARHDELLTEAVEARGGQVIKRTGDGLHAVFARADAAVEAAVDAQRSLASEHWVLTESLRVRMGLHTGVAEHRAEDYFGPVLNRAARLMGAGHGGQVLVSAATQELLRDELPAGCGLAELGEFHLRDLSRPERIFQVTHPDLLREFPPLRTLDALPANLPVQVTSFVGREDELARVVSVLSRERVVTLTGVGGVGKTRLALHAAAEALPRFHDGAWLCELQMVRDPAAVVDAVAGVFRVTARPGSTLEESLVAYLGDQELLLVLDNCEHLLDGAAALVEDLEQSCPKVVVLATSREPLAIDGERVLGVRSLGSPPVDASFDDIAHADAVRLFVERAQAVKDGFLLTRANASDVVQICDRLDGVPLAIELAAARVTAMNPKELSGRLDRRFELLAGGRRRAIERHQTLRATIDWSYDLLSESQQRLLARLAVFAGGWRLEAAETVCAGKPIEGDEVFELLAGLVARSLIVADDEGPETRYRLLETIRQYGEERLAEAGDTEALRVRHARYYAGHAAEVTSHIYGPGQLEWGARLARDRDNLLAAMAYALDTQNVDLAFGLFCEIPAWNFQINEVVPFDPTPLLALPGATEHPGSALALMLAATRTWYDGDSQLALRFCNQALVAERRLGSACGALIEYESSRIRGSIAQAAGGTQEAVEHYLDAAHRGRDADLPALAAISLANAATTLAWSDPIAARQYATEGLTLARQSGMPYAIAINLIGLAHALAATDPDEARALLAEALQLAGTLGYESLGGLQNAVFAAARLEEWLAMLGAASRVLHQQARTGAIGLVYVAAILNLVARGLAEPQPESAAVLQGAVTGMLRRLAPEIASPVSGGAPDQNDVAAFVTEVRRETTQSLTASLGQTQLRELRAQGAALDETHACTYARTHIDEYLAHTVQPVS